MARSVCEVVLWDLTSNKQIGQVSRVPGKKDESATVSKENFISAAPLRRGVPKGRKGAAMLPSRFVQPMRVDFRWLSAGHRNEEANSHPDTSPVCGWLLPNRLDESIDIYDANGAGLGSIDVSGLWRSVPGEDHPIVARDIANPHLRRVVLHILEQSRDGSYQPAFLQTINAALDAIDPDSFAASPSLALLVGRPLAVVRASVKFELQGEPAEDHSWSIVARRLAGESCNFPVHLRTCVFLSALASTVCSMTAWPDTG